MAHLDQSLDGLEDGNGAIETQFGVFSHIGHKSLTMTVGDRLREWVAELELADSLDFEYYFTAEHHFSGDFGLSPSQAITLTTIAQRTERIRFGPMVTTLPLSQPLRVAEEMLILDHMSDGRLEVGLGRGITPHELISYGVHPSEAPQRMAEGLEFLLKAWTMEEQFSFLGKYNQYLDLEIPWRPYQLPHPPIWIPTATASNAEEWGRRGYSIAGFSWLGLDLHRDVFSAYRKGWSESGRPTSEQRIGYLSAVIVADTDEEAKSLAEQHFPEMVRLFDYEESRSYWFGDTDTKRVYKGLLALFDEIKKLEYSEPQYIVIHGSPSTVVEKIQGLQSELGMNVILTEFNIGLMPWDKVQRSMELYSREVIPAIRANPGTFSDESKQKVTLNPSAPIR
jgi:alkanesulfonate monooxygenase SsuD/methylene tetrahydromethanopterin reductase-like flavin-dependent oxidoreductase (luciferase family)